MGRKDSAPWRFIPSIQRCFIHALGNWANGGAATLVSPTPSIDSLRQTANRSAARPFSTDSPLTILARTPESDVWMTEAICQRTRGGTYPLPNPVVDSQDQGRISRAWNSDPKGSGEPRRSKPARCGAAVYFLPCSTSSRNSDSIFARCCSMRCMCCCFICIMPPIICGFIMPMR